MWAMLNFDGSSSAPNAMIRSSGTPGSRRDIGPDGPSAVPPKYRLTISTGNRSIPAGTGVCVVNTVDDRTTVSAVSKSSPASIEFADAFDAEKSRVAFVHVEHLGRRQPLHLDERADRAHPADACQNLLLDPVFLVAAVEPVGDTAKIVVVLRDVGIQQQQRDSAHLRDPHVRPQLAGVRHCQLDQHRVAVLVGEQTQRQALWIQRRVGLVLPTVGGQRLPEVARAVVQPDRDQRQAQVRRGLQVIARQNAQAAGIVRKHLGDAELHGEVRDAVRQRACRLRPAAGTTAAGSGNRRGQRPARRAGRGTTRRRPARPAASELTRPSNATGSSPTCSHSSGSIGVEQVLRWLVP